MNVIAMKSIRFILSGILLFISINTCFTQKFSHNLIDIHKIDSTIKLDVKYATINNFTGVVLYKSAKVFLIKEAAEQLVKANNYLKKKYYLQIKIFDGYRPLSVQKRMWEIMPDERYVANPSKGSRHNRGCAVDLTLIDSLGNELDMGTPYDDFTEKSHIDYQDLPPKVLQNRKLLRETMMKFGFVPMRTEWWHFDYKDWKKYPILDIDIE